MGLSNAILVHEGDSLVTTIYPGDLPPEQDLNESLLHFRYANGEVIIDEYRLSTDDIWAINQQIADMNTVLGSTSYSSARLFREVSQFAEERPLIFGGIGLATLLAMLAIYEVGPLAVAAAGTKETLSFVGIAAAGYGAYEYIESHAQRPATIFGEYNLEANQTYQLITTLTAMLGAAIMRGEIAGSRITAYASNHPQLMALLNGVRPFATPFTVGHVDEAATIASTQKTGSELLTEDQSKVCQFDRSLKQWACIAEEELPFTLSGQNFIGSTIFPIAAPDLFASIHQQNYNQSTE